MAAETDLSTVERLVQLFRHLGFERAHLAGSGLEVAALAVAHPELVASVTLVCPISAATERLRPLGRQPEPAAPVLFVGGDRGPLVEAVLRVRGDFPDASVLTLADYAGALWSDPIAERADEVGPTLFGFLADASARGRVAPVRPPSGEGEVAGVTYRVRGGGPPLVLFPLGLAASQWDPLVPVLADHYCTVTLGGASIGVVAVLEQRARLGYRDVVRALVDAAAPRTGETILEVGCGPGALVRWLARYAGGANPIVGVDVNRFLLGEAAALARREGLADRIRLQEGDALALPFPDDSVDLTLSSTVMEEIDADRMLAELVRVTRPGGRVAVAVRATDMRMWINLPLRPEVRARAEAAPGPGVAADGCADASLYRRFAAAGLHDLRMGPRLAVNRPGPGLADWRDLFEARVLSTLSPVEAEEWRAATTRAAAEGTYLWADPYHCAVGTKR